MKCSAVILAGGRGERFRGAKQFLDFHGKELWRWPFDIVTTILPREQVVVVGVDVSGGETRTASVVRGLAALPKDTERVVLLEAARPLVTRNQIITLIEDHSPSSSFVTPLVDTVIGRDGTYFERAKMWDLLTPQAFDYQILTAAYATGQFIDMTDETRVMYEYNGIKPHLIETGRNLFKVTYPHDTAILETIYQEVQREFK